MWKNYSHSILIPVLCFCMAYSVANFRILIFIFFEDILFCVRVFYIYESTAVGVDEGKKGYVVIYSDKLW